MPADGEPDAHQARSVRTVIARRVTSARARAPLTRLPGHRDWFERAGPRLAGWTAPSSIGALSWLASLPPWGLGTSASMRIVGTMIAWSGAAHSANGVRCGRVRSLLQGPAFVAGGIAFVALATVRSPRNDDIWLLLLATWLLARSVERYRPYLRSGVVIGGASVPRRADVRRLAEYLEPRLAMEPAARWLLGDRPGRARRMALRRWIADGLEWGLVLEAPHGRGLAIWEAPTTSLDWQLRWHRRLRPISHLIERQVPWWARRRHLSTTLLNFRPDTPHWFAHLVVADDDEALGVVVAPIVQHCRLLELPAVVVDGTPAGGQTWRNAGFATAAVVELDSSTSCCVRCLATGSARTGKGEHRRKAPAAAAQRGLMT
jgi:hypothetical protein